MYLDELYSSILVFCLARCRTSPNRLVLDHGCCWLKAFPRRKDTGRRKQTRASLVPKKSRTKNDDEGRERSGERAGNRDGGLCIEACFLIVVVVVLRPRSLNVVGNRRVSPVHRSRERRRDDFRTRGRVGINERFVRC